MHCQTVSRELKSLSSPQVGARTFSAADGQVLFEPDTPARHVFYIRHGQIRLFTLSATRAAQLIMIIGPGDWFGSAALAEADTYQFRAVSVGTTLLTELPVDKLRATLAHHPEDLMEMIRQLACRVLVAYEESARLIFEDCEQRVIHTLIRFSDTVAATPSDDGVVLHLTHEELAQAVGVARETVSVTLTHLRQQQLLRTGRNQVFFKPEVLRRFSRKQAKPAV